MIKGLTDRESAFPEIGSIRKGSPKKVKNGVETVGDDLKWFRVEFDERELDASRDFVATFGDKPTNITIVLPFNEIERQWEAWREAYVAGALIHRCDGEFVQYAIDPKTGERIVVNGIGMDGERVRCNGKAVHAYTGRNGKQQAIYCKPVGRLRVIVPALKRAAYLVVHTTSIHDIINISRQLQAIKDLAGGRVVGIPITLRRRPVDISTPSGDGGKRVRREKWLISLEADPEWVKAKMLQLKRDALPSNGLPLPEPTTRPANERDWPDVPDDDCDEDEELDGEDLTWDQEEPTPGDGDAGGGPDLAGLEMYDQASPAPSQGESEQTGSNVPAQESAETEAAKLVITQVRNLGGDLVINSDGKLKLHDTGKAVVETVREKVRLNAKAIADYLIHSQQSAS